MQIQPVTLHWFAQKQGLRLTREEMAADPGLCVRLGIRYLRSLQERFGADLPMALMAYNAGPDRIRQAIRERAVEPFRFYPRRVKRDFERFRKGAGLGGDWAFAPRPRARRSLDAWPPWHKLGFVPVFSLDNQARGLEAAREQVAALFQSITSPTWWFPAGAPDRRKPSSPACAGPTASRWACTCGSPRRRSAPSTRPRPPPRPPRSTGRSRRRPSASWNRWAS